MALQGLALEFSARLSALFSGAASAEEAVDRLEATYGTARVRRWDEALLSSVGNWAVASVGDGPDACDLAKAMSTFALGAVRLEHWTATVYLAASGPGASAGFRVEFFFFFPWGGWVTHVCPRFAPPCLQTTRRCPTCCGTLLAPMWWPLRLART